MGNQYKKRFGDRRDGRYLRSLDAYYKFSPYIMKTRGDASVFFEDSIEVTEVDRFLRKKRESGMPGLGMLHLLVAAYVRVASQRPAINRFISGQRIYARNNIEFVMSIKKEMSSEGGETSIKVILDPTDTLTEVYNKINAAIHAVKNEAAETSTDDVANALIKLPRFILKFVVGFIGLLDYFDIAPKMLLNASPFHGSMIITDLGSLGIPPVFHHLYNFGNLPVFIAFGAKRKEYINQKDGSLVEKKYLDYTVVMDERICDGFYFAQSFKYLKSYMKHPEQLGNPPEKVVEDIF